MYNYAYVHNYYNICCLLLLYIVFSTFRTQYILHVCIIRFKLLCVSSFLKLYKLLYPPYYISREKKIIVKPVYLFTWVISSFNWTGIKLSRGNWLVTWKENESCGEEWICRKGIRGRFCSTVTTCLLFLIFYFLICRQYYIWQNKLE